MACDSRKLPLDLLIVGSMFSFSNKSFVLADGGVGDGRDGVILDTTAGSSNLQDDSYVDDDFMGATFESMLGHSRKRWWIRWCHSTMRR